ncbi:MAG: DUF1330 domain-containing protein [Alphaproteobacteria bacterium]|jgi:uncharacterized protein (DUF1330 family)|nr:DUF1330 domain-containing protein [Alphaproteobacteria bacterium]MDP6515421.1 DUF1330 domain-containing protein [Alphaproteobacteria bacterium]|tara:strand:+ start:281 stop:685 length:405 start_codon:yes stop_codon:yes gene_type:complete
METVNADREALAAMAGGDPDEPVVMLNLLRYRERAEAGYGVDGLSGREAYGIYGQRFAKEMGPKYGGEPIWMGRAHHSIIGSEEWDIVILVRYPARRLFLAMVNDPEYQAIAPIRAAALADSRLIEMSQLLPKA